jgi:hypothetical protein
MSTKLILPDSVLEYLPVVTPHLEAALEQSQNETPLHEHIRRVLAFEEQLWLFSVNNEPVGAGITRINTYYTHKALHLVLCGGVNWNEWYNEYHVVEQFAKDSGCTSVEMWGRKGWAKALPKYLPGFEQTYIRMKKNI